MLLPRARLTSARFSVMQKGHWLSLLLHRVRLTLLLLLPIPLLQILLLPLLHPPFDLPAIGPPRLHLRVNLAK